MCCEEGTLRVNEVVEGGKKIRRAWKDVGAYILANHAIKTSSR